jgi:methylated-DNA-[protein]-cysteine S-methyltransferase
MQNLPADWLVHHLETPLGRMRLAAGPRGLAGAWFAEGQRDTPALAPRAPSCVPSRAEPAGAPTAPVLAQAQRAFEAYFAGTCQHFDVPLDLSLGTAFQQAVWRALLDIPFGQTTTYREIARRIGRPEAVRAVGGAVGRNPLSILVPCHRVIGASGALTGYSGGLERKIALLRLENARGWN